MPKEIQQYLQKVKGKDLTDTQLLYLSKMPWGNSKVYNRSISEAKNILNNTHSGMSDVKDRILRYIACQKRVGSNYGVILLLEGPPGVGKTSIASAVAEAMGMKKCNEVEEVGALIEQLEACHRNIISRLPVLGRALADISFYTTLPAERAITAKILNINLKFIVDEEENEGLKKAISEAQGTASCELYFKRIALHLTAAISTNLNKNSYGQDSISLSTKMLSIISKRFESMSNRKLKKLCDSDQRKSSSIQQIIDENTYSIQIAMELLKNYKDLHSEEDWDTLIENKGGIMRLMK